MMGLPVPRRFCLLLISLAIAAAPAFGISVRTVNLPEMVELADRAFVGRCVATRSLDLGIGLPVTEYTFLVTRGLLGVASDDRVVFRQVTGSSRQGKGIAGFPGLKKGQEVLLFLYPDSRKGLTSPVGVQQGVFSVTEETGELQVVNSLNNSNLGSGFSVREAQQMGLSQEELEALQSPGPIPLRNMEASVQRMDRFYRGKGKQR